MLWGVAYGQSTGYLRYDTVRIQKVGGNSTLIIENATKGVTGGVLTNMGGGRTAFVTPSGGGSTISDSTLQWVTDNGDSTTKRLITNDTARNKSSFTHGRLTIGDSTRSNKSWVAFGTSITTFPTVAYSFVYEGYPYKVSQQHGMVAYNKGVSGSRMNGGDSSMLNRINQIPVYGSTYGAISFEFGTNDAWLNTYDPAMVLFKATYNRVIDTCIARGWPLNKIVILASSYCIKSDYPHVREYATAAMEVAAARGIVGINWFTYMENTGNTNALMYDSVHPNAAGHTVMAQAVYDGINGTIDKVGYLTVNGSMVVADSARFVKGIKTGTQTPVNQIFPNAFYGISYFNDRMYLNGEIDRGSNPVVQITSETNRVGLQVYETGGPTSLLFGGSLRQQNAAADVRTDYKPGEISQYSASTLTITGAGPTDNVLFRNNNGIIFNPPNTSTYDILFKGQTTDSVMIIRPSTNSVGIGGYADSLLTVKLGAHFKRGVRFSNLPIGPGTQALRIDAAGNITRADTTTGGGGGVTSVSAGFGNNFSTITSTGSVIADSTSAGVLSWRRGAKLMDSIATVFTPMTRTISTTFGLAGGGNLTANRTLNVDTTSGGALSWVRGKKIADSLGALISAGGGGTVTSVAAGYGTTFTTITNSGSVVVDSASIATRARVQKGIDSLGGLITGASGWGLSGNSLTAGWEAGHFLGSTNSRSLLLKTNGLLRARIDSAGIAGTYRMYFGTSANYMDYGTTNTNGLTWLVANANFNTSSAVNITSNSTATAAFYNGGMGVGTLSPLAGARLTIAGQGTTTSAINFVSTTDKTTKASGDLVRLSDWLTFTNSSAATNYIAQISGTTAPTSGRVAFYTTGGLLSENSGFTYASSRLSPTYLTLAAGTATAGTAPLLFTSGTNLTSAVAGAMEYDGTNWYLSPSTTRKRMPLTNNVTPSNGQIPIGNGTDYTVANITSSDGSVTVTNGSGTIDVATAGRSWTRNTISTSNATPATIVTIGTTSKESGIIEAHVSGISASGDQIVQTYHFFYKNVSGSMSIGNTGMPTSGTHTDAGLSTASTSFSASGTNILIQVTGVAATGIEWTIDYIKTNVINSN